MQTTTYAEHRAQVAALDERLDAAARALHLTDDERALVDRIRDASPLAKRGLLGLLSLLQRVV